MEHHQVRTPAKKKSKKRTQKDKQENSESECKNYEKPQRDATAEVKNETIESPEAVNISQNDENLYKNVESTVEEPYVEMHFPTAGVATEAKTTENIEVCDEKPGDSEEV